MLDRVQSRNNGLATRSSAARSVAWNYAGYIFQIGINFGLTSYVVRRVSVVEYGLFLFVISLSGTLYLLDMGISSVLVQAYVEALGSADRDRLNDLMGTVFTALSVLGAIGVLGFSALAISLPGPFNLPHQYLHEASLIFFIASLVIQVGLPSMALEHLYQASHRFDRINQIQLVTTTVQMILSVAVLAAGYRIVALALVLLVVSLLRILLLFVALPPSVPHARLGLRRFRWDLLRPLVHLSKWAFLNNLSAYLFDILVWIILGAFGSMKEAAMFGLASKAPKQLWNLVDKGASIALPLLSRSSAENDLVGLRRTYLRTQKLVFGAVLPFIVLGCFLAKPLIEVWAGGQYAEAAVVMQWLLLAAFSHAITYSSDLLMYAHGEVKKAATIATWSGALSVVSALLLVSRYGAAGMAAGMALTQWFINCAWFTFAACRLSQTSTLALFRVLFGGLAVPLTVLIVEVVLLRAISSHLPSPWLLLVGFAGGIVYFALWSIRTALPLYRNETEIVA